MKKTFIMSLLIAALAVPISVSATPDYASAETIKQVQEALNSAGYNCGTPDGVIGNGTRSQIEKYRADKGLTAGNAIDDELYNSLVGSTEADVTTAPGEENAVSIHLDTKYGILDFVRYELNGNNLFLVFDYQNTTDETTMPLFQYVTDLYQNGKEVSTGFSMSKPADCDFGSTNIRPGSTLRYCVVFNLSDLSPVELEVYPLYDFSKSTKETVLIDLNGTNVVSAQDITSQETPEADVPAAADENLKNQLSEANKRIEELEKQLEEANAKVSELQGQLDAIKAAIGG